MEHHHAFNAHFGGRIERRNQRVDAGNKTGNVIGNGFRVFCLFKAGFELAMPVTLQCFQLGLLTVTPGGDNQFRAEGGAFHVVEQGIVFRRKRHGSQQAITLHTQRTCLVDGMGATLHALYQPARDRHAGHTNGGGQQHDEGQLINQRQRGEESF
ncbi:hypothetical protein D3C78_1090650 [compost metagenome]